MAVKFAIRNYSRNGNDVTFTVVALNADGSIDTNYTGAFTWGLNGMSDPGVAAFSAGDLGQRTYTTTVLNTTIRTGLAANFPSSPNGANLSISGPSGTNVTFGNQGDHLIVGGIGDDTITGNNGNDLFLVQQGGNDTITGGAGNDSVYFGVNYTAADRVDGGAGDRDRVILRGNYSLNGLGSLIGVEVFELLSASNTSFGDSAASEFDYSITFDNGSLQPGLMMTIDASTLGSQESLAFNGSNETDGRFELLGGGGNDVLTGGSGDDIIYGGGRGDTLTGGAGNDIFVYRNVTDSNSTERDGIQDFNLGDRIDLSAIDANINLAGKQNFNFIGSSAFSNTAGELRFQNISLGGPIWLLQGDINGDGVSDLEIVLVISPADPITASDFILGAPNEAPVVDLNGASAGIDTSAAYLENGARITPFANIALSDVDSTTLTGATVTIASGFVAGDVLRLGDGRSGTTVSGITYNYNDLTGVLTLTGSASVAAYQAALATLRFKSDSDTPGTTRDITVTVTDGPATSVAAHLNITVTPVNDAPVNVVPVAQNGTMGSPIIFSAANGNALTVTDPDAGSSIVKVKLYVGHGTLTLSGTNGLTINSNGSNVIVMLGTMTDINAALNGLSYQPIAGYTGTDTLTLTMNDGGNGGSGGIMVDTDTVAITINPNAPPALPASQPEQPDDGAGSNIAGAFIGKDNAEGPGGYLDIANHAFQTGPDLSALTVLLA